MATIELNEEELEILTDALDFLKTKSATGDIIGMMLESAFNSGDLPPEELERRKQKKMVDDAMKKAKEDEMRKKIDRIKARLILAE